MVIRGQVPNVEGLPNDLNRRLDCITRRPELAPTLWPRDVAVLIRERARYRDHTSSMTVRGGVQHVSVRGQDYGFTH